MKVFLYHFECGEDDLYLTGDNYTRTYAGITYNIAAIENKEIAYDLKELMGEVAVTIPFAQAGYLNQFPAYPYDFPVNVEITSYETSSDTGKLIFKGFVNSFKCSKGMVELGCLSVIEQCRDNYPRLSLARHCCHRVYDAGCGLDSGTYTFVSEILGISTDRMTITASGSQADGYFSYGYLFYSGRYRHISSSSLESGNQSLSLIHPCPMAWEVGQTTNLVAGCDRSQATCTTKFNNFLHFLGFPYAPFESVRITGLRGSEIKRSKK